VIPGRLSLRRELGRLVAVLTRVYGWRNFDLVEDMVRATVWDALQSWRVPGIAANPPAGSQRFGGYVRRQTQAPLSLRLR
jgi:predicted RNA polymerase sigma factor